MATCPCVKAHRPPALELNTHHIVPKAWQGPDTPENRVVICVQTHANIHSLLNAYVRAGGAPPVAVLKQYPSFTRALARRALDAVGGVPPRVFTASHPEP